MKRYRKLLALILTVSLVLALPFSAMAESGTDTAVLAEGEMTEEELLSIEEYLTELPADVLETEALQETEVLQETEALQEREALQETEALQELTSQEAKESDSPESFSPDEEPNEGSKQAASEENESEEIKEEDSTETPSSEETETSFREESAEEESSDEAEEEASEEESSDEAFTEEDLTEEAFSEEESEEEETTEEDEFFACAQTAVTISSVMISGNKLVITATPSLSGRVYLYDLETYEDTAGLDDHTPLSSYTVTAGTAFTASITYQAAYLNDKFVFCNSAGTCISNVRYISNPQAAAAMNILHTASNKKGLLLNGSTTGVNDAVALGVKNATFSSLITEFLYEDGSINTIRVDQVNWLMKQYNDAGIVTYMILLVPRDAPAIFKHPNWTEAGTGYAAWNTSETGAAMFEACLIYLAQVMSPNVSHWIIGNEVNDNEHWNFMGPATIEESVAEYAKTFRLAYNSIKSVNAGAKIYIPVDHRWNQNANTLYQHDTKAYLDQFDAAIQAGGNIDWSLAFHAYSIPLSAPEVWDDGQPVYSYDGRLLAGGGEVNDTEYTYAITMKNIDVLTTYMANKMSKDTSGKVRTIALTEQGWTSYSERTNADAVKEQATSIAYAYNKTVSSPYLECLIVSRQQDAYEGSAYYLFGIRNGSWQTKYSYAVLRDLGTSASIYTSAVLPAITGKTASITAGSLVQSPKTVVSTWSGYYNAEAASASNSFAVSSSASDDKVIRKVLSSYNASQTPYFHAAVTISDTSVKEAEVVLRVYSKEKILESTISKVSTGKKQNILFDLSGWNGLSSINGVELWIRGVSGSAVLTVSGLTCSASNSTDMGTVSDLKAKAIGGRSIELTWTGISNVTGYVVYRKQGNGSFTCIATPSVCSYTDTGAALGVYNFYRVIPYIRTASGSIILGKADTYVYKKPTGTLGNTTNLKASSVKGGVKLTWSKVAGAEGYLVYGIRAGATYSYVGYTTKASVLTFTDTKATANGQYNFYWVFPYFRNDAGKMVVGGCSKYTYGRPLK